MLATARLQTVVCVSNLDAAHEFYAGQLGLPLKRRTLSGHIYDAGGSDLLVSPVPDPTPSAHTILGFAVDDVRTAVSDLLARGLACKRHAHLPHGADGIVTAPDGTLVAWYRDPDGNHFSVVQYAESEP